MLQKSSRHKTTDDDYIKLGRQLSALFELGSPSRASMLWSSFLRGIAQGFGAIVGGTILVALLLWILGIFNHIPLVGPAIRSISDSIQVSSK